MNDLKGGYQPTKKTNPNPNYVPPNTKSNVQLTSSALNIDIANKIDTTILHLCDVINNQNTSNPTGIADMTNALAALITARANVRITV